MNTTKVILDDVSLNITDGTHSTVIDNPDGDCYLLSCKNIKNGKINLAPTDRKISKEQLLLLKKRTQLEKNDVLLTTVGTIGEVSIVGDDNPNYDFQRSVGIIKPNTCIVNPKFLYYVLKNEHSQIVNLANGAVQQCLFIGDIKRIQIELPPLALQNKIVDLLEPIDSKIAANEKVNNNLLQQAQAVFAKEFLSFDRMPDGWKESSLLGIADYLNGLAMQKFRPKDGENGLPVLKIKELRQGSCDANSELCSPSIKKEYIVHDGDVIFSWSGSLLVDFWCGGTCGLNQHLFKVTSTSFDKWFFFAWTDHHLQKFAAIAADMATTMGHIKREELTKAEVLVPPQDEYERIGGLLAPIYDLVVANRIENRKLTTLRDELLPQLMSGNLDISEVSI